MPSQALNPLMQALQSLSGGQGQTVLPNVAQAPQQSQMPVDSNQLFDSLLTEGFQNQDKSFSQRGHTLPTESQISPTIMDNQSPVESIASSEAIQHGADPSLLNAAQKWLGKNAYVGLCEAFVERMTKGAEGLYKSAIDAWNQQTGKVSGLSGIQPGDAVYFSADPSNGNYGHTGVYAGNGQFISATYNGVKQYNLDQWQKSTGQKLLGYVPNNGHKAPPMRVQPQQPQLLPGAQQMMQKPSVAQPMTPQKQQFQPMQKSAPLQPKKNSVPSAPIHVQNNQPHPRLGRIV